MAANLNSAILNSTILEAAVLVFCLKLTHTCQDWFPPFAQKKLHSFILSELDNGNHLEFCHVGFRHWHLGFRYIIIFSQIHSKHSPSNLTLTQTNSILLKLIHSHLIDDGNHLEFCHLGFSFCIVEFRHLVYFSQIHSKTLSLQSDSVLN